MGWGTVRTWLWFKEDERMDSVGYKDRAESFTLSAIDVVEFSHSVENPHIASPTVTPPGEKQRRRLHPPLASGGWAGRRGTGCIAKSKNLA